MKFTDGHWMMKPEMRAFSPAQVVDKKITPEKITLYCSTSPIKHRGQTLNSPMITIEFTAPQQDALRIKAYHFKGGVDNGPHFELKKENQAVLYKPTEGGIEIKSGDTSAIIDFENYSCKFYYKGRLMTESLPKSLAYIVTPKGAFFREQLLLDIGECVYGLGERFTPLVKNGQSVDIWNGDGGTSSDMAYKNIPFHVTSGGYGVLVNNSGKVSYEVAQEAVSKTQFSVPGECLDYIIFGADAMKEAVGGYCGLTGMPQVPPAWSFGLWLTTSFTTDYSEETVMSFIDGMAERDIPLHVFHFDCFWMKEYEWCNFTWDERFFPEPKEMLERIKRKGLKVCCWINPYIAQKSPMFDEGMEKGYLLKKKDGGVWQWDMWQAGMALVDFTNPDAEKWYTDKLRDLLAMGVDCFKTDFGERIPTDVVYHSGADPERMHNYYSYLYNKAVFELLKEVRGEGDACVFARSATAGCQQFPVHWGGDSSSTYYSMAETLRGGLSLAASGFGFWSHDISGFEQTAAPDLYKRWCAFGLLSTHSRLHGSGSYRAPWLFDDEASDVLRFFTKLKCRLMPYIFSEACKCAKTGIPVMRPMAMEFPNDLNCRYIDTQYMLGPNLLVAPIMNDEGRGNYYLPEGRWTHLLTNEILQGGKWYSEKYDYFSLPLFVRENSVMPIGASETEADYEFDQHVEFHVFEPSYSFDAEYMVYNGEGQAMAGTKVRKIESDYKISMSCKHHNFSIVLRNVFDHTAVKGTLAQVTDLGIKISP